MKDLSIAIQHTPTHADRRKWVQAMIAQLRSEDAQIPIVLVEDTNEAGCWPTYRRALEAAGDAPHHLMLQDDLGLCRDFIGAVREIIRARPASLVALYTNSGSVFKARQRGESWIEKAGVCGPAVIWPKQLIGEFIEWQDAHIDAGFPWDTVRVSMWLLKTSQKAFVTVPSLAQHLGHKASILGLNGRDKTATWYIGANQSGLGIDWSRGLSSPPKDITDIHPEWWERYRD